MFVEGQFEKGFAGILTHIDSDVAVDVEEGNLIFTVNDLQSYQDLYVKLTQLVITMKNVIEKEKLK